MYDWLLPAEVFNEKDCPEDDIWPCTEARQHTPSFFPPGKVQFSSVGGKAVALSPEKDKVIGALEGLRSLPTVVATSSSSSGSEEDGVPRLSYSSSSSSHGGSSHSGGHRRRSGGSLSGSLSGQHKQPASVLFSRSAGGSGRMAIVAAERGSSCTDACAARASGGTCDEEGLRSLNQCESLRAHFNGCMRGCEESEGADQPAFVSPRAPESHKPGVCLVNTLGKMSCDGSHPMTSRLCACRSE